MEQEADKTKRIIMLAGACGALLCAIALAWYDMRALSGGPRERAGLPMIEHATQIATIVVEEKAAP